MKTKSLLQLSGIFMMVALVLSSCNSSIEISKRRHSKGYYVSIGSDSHKAKTEKATEFSKATTAKKEAVTVAIEETKTTTVEVADETVAANEATKTTQEKTIAVNPVLEKQVAKKAAKTSKVSKLKKAIQLKKALKEHKDDDTSDIELLLLVILAIILPPVAVFMVRGLDIHFWLSILLTLLFWLPGIIHALLVVFGKIK